MPVRALPADRSALALRRRPRAGDLDCYPNRLEVESMPDVTFEVSRQWFFWISVLAVVVGILILVRPQLLNYLVAIYLILAGGLGLAPYVQRALNL